MKVKVLRAFLVKGQVQKVGQVIELADVFAAEMAQIGRVEPVGDAPKAAKGPMKSADSPLVAGGAKQEPAE